jgi:hypothetical protein
MNNKKAIDIALDNIKWKPTGLSQEDKKELPVVTHTGVLVFDNIITINVVQLSNGMRVIPEEELFRLGIKINKG